MIEYCRT